MKKSILIVVLAATAIFSTSCSKDDGPAPITIESTLTTSKKAYQDAKDGNWVEITKEEYDNLATTLNEVSKVGTKDENYQTTSSKVSNGSAGYTLAHNNGVTIPKDSYLIAFKFNNTSDSNTIKIKTSSSTVKKDFQNLGNQISSISKGEHFYVIKENSTKLNAEGFLGYYFLKGVGYDNTSRGKSKYTYQFGDKSDLSGYDNDDVYFVYQGLSTTEKQW